MTCDYVALANQGVQGLHPYQAGKPVDELERELGISNIVKLASNENPLGMSVSAKEAIQAELSGLARYPDANGFHLKTAIAQKFSLNIDQITLGNGSNDLLEIIARSFVSANDEVIFSEHAFVVYPMVTQAIGAKAVQVPALNYGHDLKAMRAAVSAKTKMIFIANPNNPTGTLLEPQALYEFIKSIPEQIIVVLDEAYYEFIAANKKVNSLAWVCEFSNLIVCRTFSKAYGLAGLRVGFSVSSAVITDILNRVRQPFNCNSLALAAAKAALLDETFIAQSVELNNHGLAQLTQYFEAKGIEYIPSSGNFITFDTAQDGSVVYQQLLQLGVIVRPIGGYGYGLPRHLRVSIGTQQENERFIEALDQVLS